MHETPRKVVLTSLNAQGFFVFLLRSQFDSVSSVAVVLFQRAL